MTRFEAWSHGILGVYAVRLERGRVTGTCGPLPGGEIPRAGLEGLTYEAGVTALRRIEERPEEWFELGPLLQGRHVPAWPPRSGADGAREYRPTVAVRLAALEDQRE